MTHSFLNDKDKEKHDSFVKNLQKALGKTGKEKPSKKDGIVKLNKQKKPKKSDKYKIYGQKGKVVDMTSMAEEIEKRNEEFRQKKVGDKPIRTAKAGQGLGIVNQLENAKHTQTVTVEKPKPAGPVKLNSGFQSGSQFQRVLDIKQEDPKPDKPKNTRTSPKAPKPVSINQSSGFQMGNQLQQLMEQEQKAPKKQTQRKKLPTAPPTK